MKQRKRKKEKRKKIKKEKTKLKKEGKKLLDNFRLLDHFIIEVNYENDSQLHKMV